MTLWEFLRDNLLSIAIKLVALAFLILFLHVLQLPPYAIGFLAGLLLAADTGAFLIRYFRRREFYNTVRQTLSELDKKHLLSELLAPPSFIEGIILSEAVTESNKSMNDEIAKYHLASEEYREYIESPNNFRMPAYHHLDISYALDNRKGKGSSWVFGIYNLYARKNPSVIYHKQTREGVTTRSWSLLPFVPSVTWSYHF